jgi:hypothetical protein
MEVVECDEEIIALHPLRYVVEPPYLRLLVTGLQSGLQSDLSRQALATSSPCL